MKQTEKLQELVNNSDLSQLQKNVQIGFILRAQAEEEKKSEDRKLIEETSREPKVSEVVISTDELKIYTVSGRDEWDIKYPYRSIYKNAKGVWERSHTVSPTLDLAYLTYLEVKCLGVNSRFVDFAAKMLEIKIEG